MEILESRQGYQNLVDILKRLEKRYGKVRFCIRIDAAGQYAQNLEAFLENIEFDKTISIGEPKRNKDYCNVHFPKRKADAVESHACARFALVERPRPSNPVPENFRVLREVLSALQSQTKRTTRLINQLHNRLSRAFPELAVLTGDLAATSILKLLAKYPTAERIAAARLKSLIAVPYLRVEKAEAIHQAAKKSTASLRGPVAEATIQLLVEELQGSIQAEKKLEGLMEKAYDALPDGPHRQIGTIPGIGELTAAALVASIVSIDRFETPESLVNFYGVFPQENTSGFDRKGKPVPPGTMHMCQKGNDLIRKLLYMSSLVGLRNNPAIKALYARKMSENKRGDVALGHCMRKMLHLVYAIWTSGKPFDPKHHDWQSTPRDDQPQASGFTTRENEQKSQSGAASPAKKEKKAAGRRGLSPKRKAVTAATSTIDQSPPPDNSAERTVDFATLKQLVSIEQVVEALGYMDRMRGTANQRRGPCPIHQSQNPKSTSFSVNLERNIFQCFNTACGVKGDMIDLWAAVHNLTVSEAGRDLARRFTTLLD